MTRAHEAIDLASAYDRVATHLVGRERELTLTLAAVAAGRDLILEGPPGTSKSTLLRAITAEWASRWSSWRETPTSPPAS